MANSAETPRDGAPVKLTARERRFCAKMVECHNATKSALDVNWTKNHSSAKSIGYALMHRPEILAEIARVSDIAAKEAQVHAAEILREMRGVLTSDVRHFRLNEDGNFELADGAPEDAWRAVAGIRIRRRTVERKNGEVDVTHDAEIKLWSKTEAARQLGETIKLFTQKTEVVTPEGTGVLAVPFAIAPADWAAAAAAHQAALAGRVPAGQP